METSVPRYARYTRHTRYTRCTRTRQSTGWQLGETLVGRWLGGKVELGLGAGLLRALQSPFALLELQLVALWAQVGGPGAPLAPENSNISSLFA